MVHMEKEKQLDILILNELSQSRVNFMVFLICDSHISCKYIKPYMRMYMNLEARIHGCLKGNSE